MSNYETTQLRSQLMRCKTELKRSELISKLYYTIFSNLALPTSMNDDEILEYKSVFWSVIQYVHSIPESLLPEETNFIVINELYEELKKLHHEWFNDDTELLFGEWIDVKREQ